MERWNLTPEQWAAMPRDDRHEILGYIKAKAMMQSYEVKQQIQNMNQKRK